MILETDRLLLRPWEEDDAEILYEYAKSPDIGPAAGWKPHTDITYSREIIRTVLSDDETYAVCLKSDNVAIGSVGLFPTGQKMAAPRGKELEVGYWIGVPFWGKGLIPEAVVRLEKRAFEELNCVGMWCCHDEGNIKSQRCMEKCGFIYHHSEENVFCEQIGEMRNKLYYYLRLEDYKAGRQ